MSLKNDVFSRIMRERKSDKAKLRPQLVKRMRHGGVVDVDDSGKITRIKKPDESKFSEPVNKAVKAAAVSGEKKIEKKPEVKKLLVKSDETMTLKGNRIAVFVPFTKVAKEQVVFGVASKQEIDSDGDVMMLSAIEDALPAYLEFGNIREMHQLSAVGKLLTHEINRESKEFLISAKIVDPVAWQKCVDEVYMGFSLGGEITEVVPMEGMSPDGTPLRWKIVAIKLDEISLVDRPASPSALISAMKAKRAKDDFIPDLSFVFDAPKKKSALTKSKLSSSLASRLQVQHSSNKSLSSSLLSKLHAMRTSPEKVLEKAHASALAELAKAAGSEQFDAESQVEISMTAKDMSELVELGARHGIAAMHKSADGTATDTEEKEEKDESEDETEEETEEGDKSEEKDEKLEKDDSEETTEEETETEETEEKSEESEEEEKPLKKSKIVKKTTPKTSTLEKSLTKLAEIVGEGFAQFDKKLEKAASGHSSQNSEELAKQQKAKSSSFKGMFI